MSISLSLSLKAEGTEAFPATFNGLLFNFPVLIHFYSSASASEILIHFTEVVSVLLTLSAALHSVSHYVYPLRDDWYLNMNVTQSGLFLNVSSASALMCVLCIQYVCFLLAPRFKVHSTTSPALHP